MTEDTNDQSRTVAVLLTAGFLVIGIAGMGLTAAALFDIESPLADDDAQPQDGERYGGDRGVDQGATEQGQDEQDRNRESQDRSSDNEQDRSDNSYQDGSNTGSNENEATAGEETNPQETGYGGVPDFEESSESDPGRDCNPERAPTDLEAFLEEMEGSGNRGDPYEIRTVCELQAMNADLDAHYILADDIDAFDTERWNDGSGFTPIGDNESFTGSVDGLFKAIGGLTVNRSDEVGLFAQLGATAEVERLGLVEAAVRGDDRVGTLAGTVDTQVDLTDVEVDGTVRGSNRVGGVVGVNDGVLTDVTSDVTVEANGTAGGFAGRNEADGIIDSGTTDTALAGTITQTTSAETLGLGGLVGINEGTVTESAVTTTVTITVGNESTVAARAGGVVGISTEGSEITDSVGEEVVINATERTEIAAGFVGANRGTIERSEVAGTVLGTAGFVGSNGGLIEDSTTAADVTGAAVAGGFARRNTGTITGSTATGTVEATERAGGFLAVNEDDNEQAIVNDSVATGDVETRLSSTATGGFAAENGGRLADITARGDVNGSDSVGGAVGINRQTLQGATVSGDVAGRARVGGLVGTNRGAIAGSTASGNVSGVDRVGGAVGRNDEGQTETNVTDTTATGAVLVATDRRGSGDASQFGGFVGINEATITRSIATGAVNPSGETVRIAGGFAGQNDGTLRETQASGNVTAADTAGGLAAVNTDRIARSAATGVVEGGEVAGGLLGRNDGDVTNTFAAGSLSGGSTVGGLVGSQAADGSLERSYWDVDTTGQQNATGNDAGTTRVEGLETNQMQGEAASQNMDDLDFENTWLTTESYPQLRDAGAG